MKRVSNGTIDGNRRGRYAPWGGQQREGRMGTLMLSLMGAVIITTCLKAEPAVIASATQTASWKLSELSVSTTRVPHQAASSTEIHLNPADSPARSNGGPLPAAQGWAPVVADLAICGAFLSISFPLVVQLRRQKDMAVRKFYVLFSLFILLCGAGYLMNAVLSWWPAHPMAAALKVTTAAMAWLIVFGLLQVLPQAFAQPTAMKLQSEPTYAIEWRLAAERAMQEPKNSLGTIQMQSPDGAEGKRAQPWLRLAVEGARNAMTMVDAEDTMRAEQEWQKQAELLQRQNEELARTITELDDFSFVAGHDLQEPLRKLIAFSRLLRSDLGGDLPELASRDLDIITHAADRMHCMVRDLLRLSRAGRGAFHMELLSLNDCVDNALSSVSARIEETNAEIIRPLLPAALGDSTLVTQVFQNLIGNGLKFRRPDVRPRLSLTVEQDGEDWVFGVKDNGIGLKMEFAEQIFQPFKRLHSPQDYEGTGMGLAICRKAVERLGGRIWVESHPGTGAHFKFTLRKESEAVGCSRNLIDVG